MYQEYVNGKIHFDDYQEAEYDGDAAWGWHQTISHQILRTLNKFAIKCTMSWTGIVTLREQQLARDYNQQKKQIESLRHELKKMRQINRQKNKQIEGVKHEFNSHL